jgi:hypothetical protein
LESGVGPDSIELGLEEQCLDVDGMIDVCLLQFGESSIGLAKAKVNGRRGSQRDAYRSHASLDVAKNRARSSRAPRGCLYERQLQLVLGQPP